MNMFVQLVIIAVGLSMDAFAVAVCQGLKMKRIDKKQAAIISLFFGGFQAFMPFIGWLVAKQFKDYIVNVDHWIAFVLLAFIGGNMVRGGLSKGEAGDTEGCNCPQLDMRQLSLMSIATSIDALAIGVTFAFLDYPIGPAVGLIGCTTFLISYLGVCIGNYFGAKYKQKAELAGGIILIFMGIKILLEHLGVIVF